MDSCNSGSMQSSSCGDEEYDSRADSNISAFLNTNNINNPPHPPGPPPTRRNRVGVGVGVGPFNTTNNHLNPHPSHMFDPLSNYLDSMQKSPSHPNQNQNPNPFLNLDMVWSNSKAPRSEPNPADLGGFMVPCSSSQQNQAFLFSQLTGQTRGVDVDVDVAGTGVPTTHTVRHSLPPETASTASRGNDQAANGSNNTNMVRNPKKRSRASRRAPTTVLTTDTTNFRAMVQEFTGIPAQPFTSSPFPRTRLDLFGSSAIRSASSHLDPPPPPNYLLRPFAQKLQPVQPPISFSPSTSSIPSSFPPMVDNLLASNTSTNNNPSTNISPSVNYHLSSSQADHLSLLMKQQQQQQQPLNRILGFQSSSHQTPPKYPLGNCIKTQPSLEVSPSTVDSHLKMGVLEELGLSHAHVNTNTNIGGLHQNMVQTSSDGALSRVNNGNNNMRNSSAEWAHRTTGTVADNDGGILGSLSGTANYRSDNIQQRVSNGKVNYSASPTEYKGPECGHVAAARGGEGTVESWINCSSD